MHRKEAIHRFVRQIRNLDIGQKEPDMIARLLVWTEREGRTPEIEEKETEFS